MIEVLTMVSECSSPALSFGLKAAKNILSLIQIIAPLLLMISIVMKFINLAQNPEDKKIPKQIVNAAMAAVLIFMIPVILNAIMRMMDETYSLSACWNNVGDYNGTNKYISIYENDGKKKTFFTESGDYENGVPRVETTGNSEGIGETIEGTAQQIGDVVWDATDVTRKSNLTSTQLAAIFNAYGGRAKNFVPYAPAIITAEQKYNVNAFFLSGIYALESGWGTSAISRNCNNLGGLRESKNHPSNGCGRNSGGGFAYFNSVNSFIDYHASFLSKSYLTPGGSYYHGKTPAGVGTSYCNNTTWPAAVIQIANELFKKVPGVI